MIASVREVITNYLSSILSIGNCLFVSPFCTQFPWSRCTRISNQTLQPLNITFEWKQQGLSPDSWCQIGENGQSKQIDRTLQVSSNYNTRSEFGPSRPSDRHFNPTSWHSVSEIEMHLLENTRNSSRLLRETIDLDRRQYRTMWQLSRLRDTDVQIALKKLE